ncbi:tripartite motif-containing protein 16, partial [Silurus asotus]
VEDSEKIFTEMIRSMEKKRSEMKEMIKAQEEAELSRAERLLEKLEQEITDLQSRVTELEQLSHTHDHIHFLQALASGRQSPTFAKPNFHTSSIAVHQHLSFDGVRNSLSDLKKKLEEFCEEEFNKIPAQGKGAFGETHGGLYCDRVMSRGSLSFFTVGDVQIFLSEPKRREDFLKCFCYLTLDPNTAYLTLSLSEKNREVIFSKNKQTYSDHPERFECIAQVLCEESVCGRCYWEVEWTDGGFGGVFIAVSYKDISRKGRGDECRFGRNNQSWSLHCFSSSLCFFHNNIKTDLGVPPPYRIGVYVDHSAGTLSFYSVSDTMKLLHRVQTTFTQPLYAGFAVGPFSTARLCD